MSHFIKQYLILSVAWVGIIFSTQVNAEDNPLAPDFTLKSNQGENIRLKELKGNVVLINFWASWCGPCRQEMPLLEEVYKKYKKLGFELLAVNVDENQADADDFLSTVNVTFPVLYDRKSVVSQLMGVAAMPTTFILDRNGRIRHLHRGYETGYEKIYKKQIKQLIRE